MKQKHIYITTIYFLALSLTTATATVFTPLPTDINESQTIYNQSPVNLLQVNIRTVIGQGACVVGDYSGCTLDDVNNDIDATDDFKPEIKVHFQSDDFPDDGKVSNATLRLRGATSRLVDLKSYRIKLDSKKELWRKQRKLQLNKHTGDLTRIKNKLSFDLMTTIPNLSSLRTQFIQMYIDNQNYGLFTHVENVGKEYLKNRGYDKDSNIYKAENFEFKKHPELQIDANGQPLDITAFETILEQKRGDDSKKLWEMLNALNDPNNNFKTDVLDKYFNVNNILTWEAVNILMGNSDITTSNFYIFNPKGKDTFYILPWDYDQSWGYDWEETTIRNDYVPDKKYRGPHNFWATKLGQRFLSQPNGLNLLKEAVTEIKNNYLTEAKIKAFADSYYPIVYPQISQNPDFDYLDFNKDTDKETLTAYTELYNQIATTVEANYQKFLVDLNSPMPFRFDKPRIVGTNIVFEWDESVDLQGDSVTYDLEISTSPSFAPNTIAYSKKGISGTTFTTQWMLPKGKYYLRMTSRDNVNPTQNWQYATNEYYDMQNDKINYGVKEFTIDVDGVMPDTIKIDGQQNDWEGRLIFSDPNDIQEANVVDWRKGGMVQDQNNFYFAYVNDDNISTANLWAWHIFLNTDNNLQTGFDDGYDYILEGGELWKYTGDGNSWQWQFIAQSNFQVNGTFAEFKVPKNLIGNSNSVEVFFYGSNKYLKPNTPSDYMIGN